MTDLHIHTKHSDDATGEISEVCINAIEKGFTTIAITDHYEFANDNTVGQFKFDPAQTRQEVELCREKYGDKLDILFGVEIGQGQVEPEQTAKELFMDFDIKIGSLHALSDRIDIYWFDFSKVNGHDYLIKYIKEIEGLIAWGQFNILAHIGYPLRLMEALGVKKDFSDHIDYLDDVLKAIISKGIALEMNGKMLLTWLSEVGPGQVILERYKSLGGELLTFGSDSHEPKMTGYGYEMAVENAKKAGFKYLSTFKNFKFEQYKI